MLLPERIASARKRSHELGYWRAKHASEGELRRCHYQQFYTEFFGLTTADYSGKKVLDIGCGPRGSLEWADTAIERVGLDPLANEYLKLGAAKHGMKYVAAPAESIPFPSGYFDIVSSFNSLDHVDNLSATIGEIKRVTKSRGQFLLIVEINHPPTTMEPITLESGLARSFSPEFEVLKSWECAMIKGTHDVYGSALARLAAVPGWRGILCAHFVRR